MDRFEMIYCQDLEQGVRVTLYYDTITKVMYQIAGDEEHCCGICPLYNADGTLMLYED